MGLRDLGLRGMGVPWGLEGRPGAVAVPMPGEGEDLDAWLASREAVHDDLVPGTEKAIRWAEARGARTPLAVVYLHGFSASRQEIAPVSETIATALGANWFGTRLTGHGRDRDRTGRPAGAALARACVADWARDVSEAIAIGRRLGEKLVMVGTSTGASLAVLAALEPAWRDDIAALVAVSPNFALADRQAWMLDLPLARCWLPVVGGAERGVVPSDPRHALFWTPRYPTHATFALRAVQRAAAAADHGSARVPLLVFYAPADRVVVQAATLDVVGRWGARAEAVAVETAEDPGQHVITGDIRSPSTNALVVRRSLDFLSSL